MTVTLHIGAHRTATTSFQAYMRRHAADLHCQGVGFWGPLRTRKGLFAGIQPVPGLGHGPAAARRARGRILLQLDKAARQGTRRVVVSDENMMGSVRQNMRRRSLYADVGERVSRYICAFDGQVDTVVLSVRALDRFWASVSAYAVARGHAVPNGDICDRIAHSARTWRDVIADVACAAPQARIVVVPFEVNMGRSDRLLRACGVSDAPRAADPEWLNRAPDAAALRSILADRGEDPDQVPHDGASRWTPFDPTARAALREAYADDMHWLVAGADGLATLTEDLDQTRAGHTPPDGPHARGQEDDNTQRRLAQPG
ncbi:MAG: hypothetical protein AAFQ19_15700 [Pseudomonadota bacterium]